MINLWFPNTRDDGGGGGNNVIIAWIYRVGVSEKDEYTDTDTDTDTDNFFIVSSGVYIVKYIFKSWNNQQLVLRY